MPGPIVYISNEERWEATKIKENSRCYCELYHCKPFLKIPTGKPKKCELRKEICFAIWISILIAILIAVICAIATQINYCGRQGLVDCNGNSKICISKNQVCDGVKDCPSWDDENDCKSKFKEAPEFAVCLVGERCVIQRTAVLGSEYLIRWDYTNLAGEGQLLVVGREKGIGNDEYGITTSKKDNGYDLQIYRLVEGHADQTYVSTIYPGSLSKFTRVIAVDEWTCSPGFAGRTVRIGEFVTLNASVRFYGNVDPVIHWYDPDGNRRNIETGIMDHGSFNTLTVTHSFTVEGSHHGEFKAYLFRSLPARHISSPPDAYTASCSTYMNVLSSPSKVSINFNKKKNYTVNSQITCSANGNPEPTFSWLCEQSSSCYGNSYYPFTQYGSNFTIPLTFIPRLLCICNASNMIDGITYSSTDTECIDTARAGSDPGRPIDIYSVWSGVIFVLLLVYRK